MSQQTIIYPLIAMFVLTMSVAIYLLKCRYRAVLQDGINPRYFELNRGAKIPDYLNRVTQHYDNLFEMPLLFYVVSILYLVLHQAGLLTVILAWVYVISRCIHAYIHIFNNRLKYRKYIFLMSSLVLIVLWMKLFIQITV